MDETEPIFRAEPGCDLCCPRCSIVCATVVEIRDEIWREIEELRRDRANRPTDEQVRLIALRIDELEDAERAVERVRPQFPGGPQLQSYRRTFSSTLVH